MNFEFMYKMVKYLVCGAIVFFVLKYILNNNMPLADIALISIITMLIFAVVENGYSLVRGKNDKQNQGEQNEQKERSNKMCESFCEMKEHMGNIGNIGNMAPTMVSPNISEQPVPNKMSETDRMNSIINSMKNEKNEKNDNMSQDSYYTSPSSESQMFPSNIISEDAKIPEVIPEARQEIMREYPVDSEEEMKYVKIPQEEKQRVKVSDPKLSDYDRFQKRFAEIIDERQQHDEDYVTKTGKIDRNSDGSYSVNYQRRSPDIVASGSRAQNGVTKETDMKYNITSYHTVPPNLNKGSFEYGYSFLPPANWYPTPPFPPVCVAEKQCPVCPVYTTGTNVELKEWDSSRRVTAPDEINVKYIEEKLNSGR
jgi:hypothetical protein